MAADLIHDCREVVAEYVRGKKSTPLATYGGYVL